MNCPAHYRAKFYQTPRNVRTHKSIDPCYKHTLASPGVHRDDPRNEFTAGLSQFKLLFESESVAAYDNM